MLRNVTVFILLGLGLGSSAQNWCPPGATWIYDSYGFVGLQGYTMFTYGGDTLLGGEAGQLITAYTVGIDFNQQVDTLIYPGATITSHNGDLVSVWSDAEQAWDTLYNFAAVPGESWLPPFAQLGLCGGAEFGDAVQVLDTGTVVIDGVPLRYLDIHNGFYDGRITELLGWSMGMVLFEGCWVQECYCDLRCYHDDALSYVRPGYTEACEAIPNGIQERESRSLEIFPNPGNDKFTLTLPRGSYTIELFDAAGRCVLVQRTNELRPLVDTRKLTQCLFLVSVRNGDGERRVVRWVKE